MGYRLIIALLVCIALCKAHGQEFVQHHMPNDSISALPPVVRVLPNGDLWAAWSSWDIRTTPWSSRLHIRKFDPGGQLLAANDLRFSILAGGLSLFAAALLPDGGVALAGRFNSKALLVRVDASAQLMGATHYSMTTAEAFSDVVVQPDNSLMLVGQCRDGGGFLPWIVRTDANGVLVDAWSDRIAGMEGGHQIVRPTDDGGSLLLGTHFATVDSSGMHIAKLDGLGELEWGRFLSARHLRPVQAIQRTDGGWFVLAQQLIEAGVLSGAPVLFRIDADGTIGSNTRLWAAQQSSSPYSDCSMDRLQDGTLIACAAVSVLNGTAVFTMDSNGVPEPAARFVPDSALALRMKAMALDNGDLLFHGERVDTSMNTSSPLLARWDTTSAFPCGSSMVPVYTDSIGHGLDSMFVRILLSPLVEDITAQILPDTITWTVSDPCAISTAVQTLPHVGTGLRAFPNPADRTARWAGLPGTQELALLDARGQVMRSWQRPLPEVLELSGLPNGLYLLVAKSNNGMRSTRVLVQH